MKNFKIITGFIASIVLIMTILISCIDNNNELIFNKKNDILKTGISTNNSFGEKFEVGENIIQYNSEIEKGHIKSSLTIFKGNLLIYQSFYDLDTTVSNFRLLQHKKVEQISKSLKYSLKANDYNDLSVKVRNVIEIVYKKNSGNILHFQSINFHYAIIKTKQRAILRKDGLYQCLPHPGYILGKSNFVCQEDLLMNVELLRGIFSTHPELNNNPEDKELFDYLSTIKEEFIPYDKFYSFSFKRELFKNIR